MTMKYQLSMLLANGVAVFFISLKTASFLVEMSVSAFLFLLLCQLFIRSGFNEIICLYNVIRDGGGKNVEAIDLATYCFMVAVISESRLPVGKVGEMQISHFHY